jgi:hypothetical protein
MGIPPRRYTEIGLLCSAWPRLDEAVLEELLRAGAALGVLLQALRHKVPQLPREVVPAL